MMFISLSFYHRATTLSPHPFISLSFAHSSIWSSLFYLLNYPSILYHYQINSILLNNTDTEINSMDKYKEIHARSIKDSEGFWGEQAGLLDWFTPHTHVKNGGFEQGDVSWYLNGKLNACYNAVDRHALGARKDKVAILYEGDAPEDVRKITYGQLLGHVCQLANSMKAAGVKKGDSVCIYMPMVPEAAFAMLACARIGAPHSVVFAGFSSEALRDRMVDGKCKYLITANEGVRGGKIIPLKKTVDAALRGLDTKQVWVYKRTDNECDMQEHRDVFYHEAVSTQRPYCPCEVMDSEDTLFMLFTSGSTGKPKGIAHTTGGYMVWTSLTHKTIFDLKEDDVYACVADVGWITGHSYIVYGPLSNGSTSFMFESTPLFPNPGRYWDMVQRHKISIFYTAPTAIRALMKFDTKHVEKYDLSSLRILGSVGEPINPEAWRWYYDHVGRGNCAIVDTYWQTETGGFMVTPFPGCTPMKPGAASTPFLGIDLALMDEKGSEIPEQKGEKQEGILCVKQPWPGMARTVFGDHQRYLNVYMTAYPGYYFTGDGCTRDEDGFYWVTGRVDDVINVSGHRLGSAEIESALVAHEAVAESAVIGIPHSVKGQALFAYVIPKVGVKENAELVQSLRNKVKTIVGSFAKPDHVLITPSLPKTRSGKIMRRLLRKIACGEGSDRLGDVSTLADPKVVDALIAKRSAMGI